MKIKIYITSVLFCGVLLFSGCEVPWEKQAPPLAEEEITIDKETVFESYIQQNMTDERIDRADIKLLLEAFDDDAIFDDEIGPEALKGYSYEEKVKIAGEFIQKMMQDTGRMRISPSDGKLTDEEIPTVDIVTGAKKYFHGADGEDRYAQYLAERFNIGIYPTPAELDGQWEAQIIFTHVTVFKEKAGAPNYDPKDLTAKIGREDNVNFVIEMKLSESQDTTKNQVSDPLGNDANESDREVAQGNKDAVVQKLGQSIGVLRPLGQKDKETIPFYYDFIPKRNPTIESIQLTYSDIKDNGKFTGQFSGKDIQGSIHALAKKGENGEDLIEGDIFMNVFGGYIEAAGKLTAVKK